MPILAYCEREGLQLWEFVVKYEGPDILAFIENIWLVMLDSIQAGLNQEGVLPGGLKLQRKASHFFAKSNDMTGPVSDSHPGAQLCVGCRRGKCRRGQDCNRPDMWFLRRTPRGQFYLRNQYKLPVSRSCERC
jgi:L-serine dehydratase